MPLLNRTPVKILRLKDTPFDFTNDLPLDSGSYDVVIDTAQSTTPKLLIIDSTGTVITVGGGGSAGPGNLLQEMHDDSTFSYPTSDWAEWPYININAAGQGVDEGYIFKLRMGGLYSSTGSPHNFDFFVRMNHSDGSKVGALTFQLPASVSAKPWEINFEIAVRSYGASGVVVGSGTLTIWDTGDGTITKLFIPAEVTIDMTGYMTPPDLHIGSSSIASGDSWTISHASITLFKPPA